MNSYLDKSVPPCDMIRRVSYPTPPQDRYSYQLTFLPMVDFRYIRYQYYLFTIISHPYPHPYIN